MKRRRPRWSLPPHDAIMDDRQRVYFIRWEGRTVELVPFPDPPPMPTKKRRGRGNA